MKPELYLQIPRPCHENWDKMTPAAKGRFCSSCSKEVVDFSLMTDAEVLNYFKKTTGNTCGRFYPDQLGRALQETKIEKKKGWKWLMATIASFILIEKTTAQRQGEDIVGKVAIDKGKKPEVTAIKPMLLKGDTVAFASLPGIMPISPGAKKEEEKKTTQPGRSGDINFIASEVFGDVTICRDAAITTPGAARKIELSGYITDERNMPVAFATVYTDEGLIGTTTNEKGYFKTIVQTSKQELLLNYSSIGFEKKTDHIALTGEKISLRITMHSREQALPEIVAVGYGAERKRALAGEVIICSKPSVVDSVKSSIQKLVITATNLFSENYKVYPNPVSKNGSVQISVNTPGTYIVTLLDNASRILQKQETNAAGKQQSFTMNLPANIASGYYYVQIVNRETKRSATQKLIVQ